MRIAQIAPLYKRAVLSAFLFCSALLALLGIASAGRGQRTSPSQSEVERGKYLVEQVAMCGECHTPRDAAGNLDMHEWLQGAPIWIMPVKPIPNWADRAPTLAGLPSFTEQQMERVLEEGVGPESEVLRPPMHRYHMTQADAKAIIAYLRSIPTEKH
jgi:mono/diheme cytochrome c family protein